MTGFAWKWPVVLLIAAIIFVALIIVVLLATRAGKLRKAAANSDARAWGLKERIAASPVAGRFKVYKRATAAIAALAALAFATTAALAARPSSVKTLKTADSSRDIVLCLDVSGSALPFDRQVISTYLNIVSNFKTERIGMSIFNSTSRTVFPLTDDYSLVEKELRNSLNILKGIESQKSIDNMTPQEYQAVSNWLAGTQNRKDSTSLIGDGLMSCEAMMPNFTVTATQTQPRISPASIVLATDNVLSGTPMYTLKEALNIAKRNSIRVDGLYSGDSESLNAPTTIEMKKDILAEGGSFMTRQNGDSVDDLVRAIEQQKIRHAVATQTVNLTDQPLPWLLAIGVLMAALFILLGWVKR